MLDLVGVRWVGWHIDEARILLAWDNMRRG